MTDSLQFHILIEKTTLMVDIVAINLDTSRSVAKQCLSSGCVWLEQQGSVRRVRKAKKEIHVGSIVHIYYSPAILQCKPQPANLIADETCFSVWNKPKGMYSQGSKWGDHCSIARYVETHLQRNTFVVHRLDKATDGLIVVAHTKQAARNLSEQFEQRTCQKHYRAQVRGIFPNDSVRIIEPIDDKPAESIATCLKHDTENNISFVSIKIKTGRKHQIRKHLSFIGYPIIGDRLYASDDSNDLQLSAVFLSFNHPVTGHYMEYTLSRDLDHVTLS